MIPVPHRRQEGNVTCLNSIPAWCFHQKRDPRRYPGSPTEMHPDTGNYPAQKSQYYHDPSLRPAGRIVTPARGNFRSHFHIGDHIGHSWYENGQRNNQSPYKCTVEIAHSRRGPEKEWCHTDPYTDKAGKPQTVSYTHLRAHETDSYLVCRLL